MNSEERKIYNKEYYEKNKKSIQDRYKQKVICECGRSICKMSSYGTHKRSKFHTEYIKKKEEEREKENMRKDKLIKLLCDKEALKKLKEQELNEESIISFISSLV